mmetsp:Transcript_19596/g.40920  ORF Transcript_19596/g.40920 Transcript_19596/m.40920 type:complete len:256 (-) Transcript_19596:2021-2788(-)
MGDLQENFLQRCHADAVIDNAKLCLVRIESLEKALEVLRCGKGQLHRHLRTHVREKFNLRDGLLHHALDLLLVEAGALLYGHHVTYTKSLFEEKGRSSATKFSVGHNGDPVTEQVGFVHEVGGENNGAALLHLPNDVPSEPARVRVHAGGGLVEEDDLAASDESYSDAELPLHAATQLLALRICLLGESNLCNHFSDLRLHLARGHTLEGREEHEVLPDGKIRVQDIMLWAYTEILADVFHLSLHVLAINMGHAT